MEIRELAPALALVIGEYHLKRTVKGGGDASGRYTLLLRKIGPAWKIIHDHSSPN
jgi:ketosteroid isomerase-like protein